MKLKSIGRAALATGMSLGIGLGATACSRDYTVAYVYATSAANASVSAFAVDYQSGALTQITGSPFTGTGRNPVYLVASPNGKFIYTINHDDSNVTVFAVGSDGKLYGQQTASLSPSGTIPGGTLPTSAAIDSTGAFLYVTFTYQPQYTKASTGPGGVTIFPIIQTGSTAGQLGTPLVNAATNTPYVPVGNNPVGITVSNPTSGNVFVYVLDQEPAPHATILGFQQNPTTGALTMLSGTAYNSSLGTYQGYAAGVTPSAIKVEPTTRFVYVTDETSNQIYGYQVATTSTTLGNLVPLISSPYITGQYPINMTIDPRGKYVLTANYNSNTISSLTINAANGSLGGVASAGAAPVATAPTCVTVEPALGIYVYSSNSLDGSISGQKMDANTGQLSNIANTPFPASTLPSCVTAVANGSHAQSIDNP